MNLEEFEKNAHEMVDWMVNYYRELENFPVKSQVKPGEIKDQIPSVPPQSGESFRQIMEDVDQIIMPGITHWQHPNFHAYFPGNSSFPAILGEMMTSTIASQCMIWETSPAAAELEERMMQWFKTMMGLPDTWHGVIQDTASTATLVALISAREKATDYGVNLQGITQRFRVYSSTETHSSIEKAIKIAGIGADNGVKIPVDGSLKMDTGQLQKHIERDLKQGSVPLAVVSTLGTTSTLAFDDLEEISAICNEFQLWHHVDAAYAGSAFILEEYQHYLKGLCLADSYLFNPHKWLFTNFDCTAYFVKDKENLIRTFEILPEYLKTDTHGKVNDYRDWGIQLGRRFRALKLWFVLRSYGTEGLRKRLREHISYAQWLASQIKDHPRFELMTQPEMNVIVFRFLPDDLSQADKLNEELVAQINESGKAYLTHTKVNGNYAIRVVTGQTYITLDHVKSLWELILSTSGELSL